MKHVATNEAWIRQGDTAAASARKIVRHRKTTSIATAQGRASTRVVRVQSLRLFRDIRNDMSRRAADRPCGDESTVAGIGRHAAQSSSPSACRSPSPGGQAGSRNRSGRSKASQVPPSNGPPRIKLIERVVVSRADRHELDVVGQQSHCHRSRKQRLRRLGTAKTLIFACVRIVATHLHVAAGIFALD